MRSPGSTVLPTTKPRAARRICVDHRKLSSGLCLDGRDVSDIFCPLRMPGIMGRLHPGPDARAVAKKLAKPNRDGCGHRLSFLQDVVKMLARNPEQSGDLRLGPPGGRN